MAIDGRTPSTRPRNLSTKLILGNVSAIWRFGPWNSRHGLEKLNRGEAEKDGHCSHDGLMNTNQPIFPSLHSLVDLGWNLLAYMLGTVTHWGIANWSAPG